MKVNQYNYSEAENMDGQQQAFDPVNFFLKYLKYWPYVAVSVLLALTAGYFVNKTTPPVYQIEGKFMIMDENSSPSLLDLTGIPRRGLGFNDPGQLLSNHAILMKSRPMAEKVLDIMDLSVDYYMPGTFVDEELYKDSPVIVQVDWNHPQVTGDKIRIKWSDQESFTVDFPGSAYMKYQPGGGASEEIEMENHMPKKTRFGEWVDYPDYRFQVVLMENMPEGEILIDLRTKGSLLSKYTGDDLQVWPLDGGSSILGISLNTSNSQKGAEYLNTLMEVYLEMELEEKNRVSKRTVDFIDSQISGVADTLNYFEANLETYRSTKQTYNISAESDVVFQEITGLERQLSQEKWKRQFYQNLQNYLVRESYDQIIIPSGIGIDDPILNSLIESLIILQNERKSLLATQTEASPRVREVSRKIQDVNASLSEVLRNVNSNTQNLIADLEERIRTIEGQFRRLPGTEQDLIKIQRGFTLNESIYTFLLQRRAEAAIAMASNIPSNRIVEYSRPNSLPISGKAMIVYILSLAFGFGFPVMIIGIITLMDKKIRDIKELETDLMVPLLGKISRNKTGTSLAVFTEPRSAIAETFRALKTNISFVVPLEKQLTVAVSSTLSGEGKTFTAINLASVYSMNKRNTILVSCDMFKPSSLKDFELKNKTGLSNYLSQQVDSVPEIIQATQYPLFHIITAGAIPPNPSDLLASDRFVNLLQELKKKYDVIVLDTPPVGLISQSFEIIKHVDLITYVMRYNFSEKSFIEDLNDIKTKKGIQNIYAVLNDVSAKELAYKGVDYGYYEEKNKKISFVKNLFSRNRAAI